MADALVSIFDGRPLLIPAGGPAYSTRRMTLDGRAFTLQLAWNGLANGWFFSLLDSEDVPIMAGVRIVANWPLLRWKKWDPRCPPGELSAIDETGDGTPPTFDDFGEGKRVQLIYFAQT